VIGQVHRHHFVSGEHAHGTGKVMPDLGQKFHFPFNRGSARLGDPFPQASFGQQIREPGWKPHITLMPCTRIFLETKTQHRAVRIVPVAFLEREPRQIMAPVQASDQPVVKVDAKLLLR